MYCEFLWADDEAGGDDAGDVWYRAFIRNKDGEKASILQAQHASTNATAMQTSRPMQTVMSQRESNSVQATRWI